MQDLDQRLVEAVYTCRSSPAATGSSAGVHSASCPDGLSSQTTQPCCGASRACSDHADAEIVSILFTNVAVLTAQHAWACVAGSVLLRELGAAAAELGVTVPPTGSSGAEVAADAAFVSSSSCTTNHDCNNNSNTSNHHTTALTMATQAVCRTVADLTNSFAEQELVDCLCDTLLQSNSWVPEWVYKLGPQVDVPPETAASLACATGRRVRAMAHHAVGLHVEIIIPAFHRTESPLTQYFPAKANDRLGAETQHDTAATPAPVDLRISALIVAYSAADTSPHRLLFLAANGELETEWVNLADHMVLPLRTFYVSAMQNSLGCRYRADATALLLYALRSC